jgi:phosphosulfolactate phosphohydrolase-like enzyme
VGTDRGGLPHRWGDPDVAAFAAAHDAALAVRRREVSVDHLWSLSPAVLCTAPVTPRLVLPSPNGSTIESALRSCGSARQPVDAGHGDDVEVAAQLDSDRTVPVLDRGAFTDRGA